MLAYELYLPLSAAGFGLASGEPGIWPQGLLVMLVHLSLATVLGLATLVILRFRPLNVAGYAMGAGLMVISLILLVALTGLGALAFKGNPVGVPTPTPSLPSLPSITPATLSTATRTAAPQPSQTPTPEPTPTITPTPTATPVYAIINARGFDSAIVREAPGFNSVVVTGLANGSLVVVLPETETIDGSVWVHIFISQTNQEGWVLQTVLILATPTPNP
jgi:hypothetical protein